jgi:hypothetical protein
MVFYWVTDANCLIIMDELRKHNDKHQANDFLDKYAKGRKTLFVWVLDDIDVETEHKPYSYSSGSWCNI